MASIPKNKNNSRSVKHDQKGRPYREGVNGQKDYLTWEESCRMQKARATRLQHELNLANGSLHATKLQVQWKQSEIDELKQEVALYQVAYLQEEDEVKKAIAEIGRVLHKQDRYTKKQLVERMTEIMLKLHANAREHE